MILVIILLATIIGLGLAWFTLFSLEELHDESDYRQIMALICLCAAIIFWFIYFEWFGAYWIEFFNKVFP